MNGPILLPIHLGETHEPKTIQNVGYIPTELTQVLTSKNIDLEDELLDEIIDKNIGLFANEEERKIENERKRKLAIYQRVFSTFIKEKTFESIFEIEEYIAYHILRHFIQKGEIEMVKATISILQKKGIEINCPTLAYTQIEVSSLDIALLRCSAQDTGAQREIIKTLLASGATSLIAQKFGTYEKFFIEQKKLYKALKLKADTSLIESYTRLSALIKSMPEKEGDIKTEKKQLLAMIGNIKNPSQISLD